MAKGDYKIGKADTDDGYVRVAKILDIAISYIPSRDGLNWLASKIIRTSFGNRDSGKKEQNRKVRISLNDLSFDSSITVEIIRTSLLKLIEWKVVETSSQDNLADNVEKYDFWIHTEIEDWTVKDLDVRKIIQEYEEERRRHLDKDYSSPQAQLSEDRLKAVYNIIENNHFKLHERIWKLFKAYKEILDERHIANNVRQGIYNLITWSNDALKWLEIPTYRRIIPARETKINQEYIDYILDRIDPCKGENPTRTYYNVLEKSIAKKLDCAESDFRVGYYKAMLYDLTILQFLYGIKNEKILENPANKNGVDICKELIDLPCEEIIQSQRCNRELGAHVAKVLCGPVSPDTAGIADIESARVEPSLCIPDDAAPLITSANKSYIVTLEIDLEGFEELSIDSSLEASAEAQAYINTMDRTHASIQERIDLKIIEQCEKNSSQSQIKIDNFWLDVTKVCQKGDSGETPMYRNVTKDSLILWKTFLILRFLNRKQALILPSIPSFWVLNSLICLNFEGRLSLMFSKLGKLSASRADLQALKKDYRKTMFNLFSYGPTFSAGGPNLEGEESDLFPIEKRREEKRREEKRREEKSLRLIEYSTTGKRLSVLHHRSSQGVLSETLWSGVESLLHMGGFRLTRGKYLSPFIFGSPLSDFELPELPKPRPEKLISEPAAEIAPAAAPKKLTQAEAWEKFRDERELEQNPKSLYQKVKEHDAQVKNTPIGPESDKFGGEYWTKYFNVIFSEPDTEPFEIADDWQSEFECRFKAPRSPIRRLSRSGATNPAPQSEIPAKVVFSPAWALALDDGGKHREEKWGRDYIDQEEEPEEDRAAIMRRISEKSRERWGNGKTKEQEEKELEELRRSLDLSTINSNLTIFGIKHSPEDYGLKNDEDLPNAMARVMEEDFTEPPRSDTIEAFFDIDTMNRFIMIYGGLSWYRAKSENKIFDYWIDGWKAHMGSVYKLLESNNPADVKARYKDFYLGNNMGLRNDIGSIDTFCKQLYKAFGKKKTTINTSGNPFAQLPFMELNIAAIEADMNSLEGSSHTVSELLLLKTDEAMAGSIKWIKKSSDGKIDFGEIPDTYTKKQSHKQFFLDLVGGELVHFMPPKTRLLLVKKLIEEVIELSHFEQIIEFYKTARQYNPYQLPSDYGFEKIPILKNEMALREAIKELKK